MFIIRQVEMFVEEYGPKNITFHEDYSFARLWPSMSEGIAVAKDIQERLGLATMPNVEPYEADGVEVSLDTYERVCRDCKGFPADSAERANCKSCGGNGIVPN